MTIPLKLLGLPILAIAEILKPMDPIELLNLSQTSRKVSRLIFLANTHRWEVSFDKYIIIHTKKYSYNKIITQTAKWMSVMMTKNGNSEAKGWRTLYWKSADWISLVFHIIQVFKCSITKIRTGYSMNFQDFQRVMEFIMARQSEMKLLELTPLELDENVLEGIFKRIKITDTLTIFHKFSPKFCYRNDPKHIYIKHSGWFGLKNLLDSNCVSMELSWSSLSNRHLNMFLKKWMAGKYPNLHYLKISGEKLNFKGKILGIELPIEEIEDPWVVEDTIGGTIRTCVGSVQIRRPDGVKAYIHMDESGAFPFHVELTFFVWK
ncbi:hypothetical protein CRE_14598 [Caenorhabditis remanei]|uniref:Uncharacterized protein n=1 Tax=Caenorhabditis remanei TaxID=31234 RepID=E3M9S2_CAERE|nr:hypothetical protein CRE_14598 [Caenorhabditis remanei]